MVKGVPGHDFFAEPLRKSQVSLPARGSERWKHGVPCLLFRNHWSSTLSEPSLRRDGLRVHPSPHPRIRLCTVECSIWCSEPRFVAVSELKPGDHRFGTMRSGTSYVTVAKGWRGSMPGWLKAE